MKPLEHNNIYFSVNGCSKYKELYYICNIVTWKKEIICINILLIYAYYYSLIIKGYATENTQI